MVNRSCTALPGQDAQYLVREQDGPGAWWHCTVVRF
jgi:hypothetical protein